MNEINHPSKIKLPQYTLTDMWSCLVWVYLYYFVGVVFCLAAVILCWM